MLLSSFLSVPHRFWFSSIIFFWRLLFSALQLVRLTTTGHFLLLLLIVCECWKDLLHADWMASSIHSILYSRSFPVAIKVDRKLPISSAPSLLVMYVCVLVCMCVYVCMHVLCMFVCKYVLCMRVYLCMYVLWMCVCMYVYVCTMYVCMYVLCMCVYMYALCMCVCMCECMYVLWMCACMYVCMYVFFVYSLSLVPLPTLQ
jgi:hypothetical protein